MVYTRLNKLNIQKNVTGQWKDKTTAAGHAAGKVPAGEVYGRIVR
jgi:hypothetical protein